MRKINKFNKILHFEREKVKKGFEKSENFEKITKVPRFHCIKNIFDTVRQWHAMAFQVSKVNPFAPRNFAEKSALGPGKRV